MIKVRMKIGDSAIVDTHNAYGLVYYKSDNYIAAPQKEFPTTTYAGQEGANIIPITIDDTFDYSVEFFVGAVNGIEDAHETIKAFNNLLFTTDYRTGLKTYNQIEFYNDYKKLKIVGIPQIIAQPTEFWRDKEGKESAVVVVELLIKVGKPSLCSFSNIIEPTGKSFSASFSSSFS